MVQIDIGMPETCDTCPLMFLRNMEWFCPFDRNRPIEFPTSERKNACPLQEESDVLAAQKRYIDELQDRFRRELGEAIKEIKRLDDENAALSKMLSSMSLQGRKGW